jgi:peptide-methionine (S)-S-oxide reductase
MHPMHMIKRLGFMAVVTAMALAAGCSPAAESGAAGASNASENAHAAASPASSETKASKPMASDSVGDVLPAPKIDVPKTEAGQTRQAVFAGGCFWCTEAVFEQLEGVTEVTSGYSGGDADTANYKAVCTGQTGHAEAIRITYDPAKLTFGELLRVHFATHDPTTLNRQGADKGTQYRSAIFYADDEEKHVAEAYIRQLDEAKVFSSPIVTTLEPLAAFYPAEEYHQDYVFRSTEEAVTALDREVAHEVDCRASGVSCGDAVCGMRRGAEAGGLRVGFRGRPRAGRGV